MEFVFSGFRDVRTIREFSFERVADDRSRSKVTVDADMSLARKYKILMQDLPLLCRRLLDSLEDNGFSERVTFSEQHMTALVNAAREAAERKPARRHRPPSAATGQAWRGPQAHPPPMAEAAAVAIGASAWPKPSR
jgi:hypothetical protein